MKTPAEFQLLTEEIAYNTKKEWRPNMKVANVHYKWLGENQNTKLYLQCDPD